MVDFPIENGEFPQLCLITRGYILIEYTCWMANSTRLGHLYDRMCWWISSIFRAPWSKEQSTGCSFPVAGPSPRKDRSLRSQYKCHCAVVGVLSQTHGLDVFEGRWSSRLLLRALRSKRRERWWERRGCLALLKIFTSMFFSLWSFFFSLVNFHW